MSVSEILSATEPAAESITAPAVTSPAKDVEASATTSVAVTSTPPSVEDARRIYLGNLPRKVKPDDITSFLEGYTVENVSIPNTHKRSRGKGPAGHNVFAFVDLVSAVEAQKALETLNENLLQDRKISVKLAKPIIPRPQKPKAEDVSESDSKGQENGEGAEKKKSKKKSKAKKDTSKDGDAESSAESSEEKSEKKSKSKSPRFKRERAPEDMSPSDSIFIRNLPAQTTKEQLAEFLKDLEPIWTHVSYKFVRSAKTNRSFRQFFGFAKLKDTATQQKAIAEYSGKELEKRVIKVAAVTAEKPKEENSDESKEDKKTTKEDSKEAVKEAPKEVKAVPEDVSKEPSEEVSKEAVKETPKEVAKETPQEVELAEEPKA